MTEFEELWQREKLWNYCLRKKDIKKFSCKPQS